MINMLLLLTPGAIKCYPLTRNVEAHLRSFFFGLAMMALTISSARAGTICTVMADAKNKKILLEHGDCRNRISPASTFKIAIALMGFDSSVLKDEHSPTLPFRKGYPDWGGVAWQQETDPARWMKYSVVWFSQRITHSIGDTDFKRYTEAFRYGNGDVSGDPGKQNGLDRAWISSSLKISPLEQIIFLEGFVNRQLPMSTHAFDMTERIIEVTRLPNGWDVHGKTGTAFPRDQEGVIDEAHGYGWFVGWAIKEDHTLVFARLDQDEHTDSIPAGLRVRDKFLKEFPLLADLFMGGTN